MVIITLLFFLLGLVFLVRGASWIVDSSAFIAKKLGVSSLVIGLTVVAFGTSLPELVVNLFAGASGNAEIVFGNVIGSNVANILLVLGLVAVFGKVRLSKETIWHETPFALLAVLVLLVLCGGFFGNKEFLTRNDGLILLALFGAFIYYIYSMARQEGARFDVSSITEESGVISMLKFALGLVGIYFGGQWVVQGAVFIAGVFGLSEFLISVTIIAVGTSLPELVVGIIASLRGNVSLAVGQTIGSNVFNICWVLGIVPLISPLRIPDFVILDIWVMGIATMVLFIFVFIGEKHELRRVDGLLLLLFYVLYILFAVARG